VQLDGEASVPCLIDERRDFARRGDRRRNAYLVLAEQRHRATQLLHAVTANLLCGSQRLLCSIRVAAEDVPRTRHLEHHPSEAVTDEVVHVTGDPTTLGVERLLGQLASGAFELEDESFLASDSAADEPGERDGHDPDAHGDLGGVLEQGRQHGRSRCDQAERHRHADGRRPARGREGQQTGVEHDWLEVSGLLHQDGRHDNRGSDDCERHSWDERPESERSDRHGCEEEIAGRRRLRDRRDEEEGQRKQRDDAAKVVSLEPTSTGACNHVPTVLRGFPWGLLPRAESHTPTQGAVSRPSPPFGRATRFPRREHATNRPCPRVLARRVGVGRSRRRPACQRSPR
jgi:hypothetical protein